MFDPNVKVGFQSRNREAYGFKSSDVFDYEFTDNGLFQSRNREAYGFKSPRLQIQATSFYE